MLGAQWWAVRRHAGQGQRQVSTGAARRRAPTARHTQAPVDPAFLGSTAGRRSASRPLTAPGGVAQGSRQDAAAAFSPHSFVPLAARAQGSGPEQGRVRPAWEGEGEAAERNAELRSGQAQAPFHAMGHLLCCHAGNRRPAAEPWPRVGGDHRQEEALWLVGPDDPQICSHAQRLYRVSSLSSMFAVLGCRSESPLLLSRATTVGAVRAGLPSAPECVRGRRLQRARGRPGTCRRLKSCV